MIKKLRSCFSVAPVNTARQTELDTGRGLCVIFMILTHAYENVSKFFDPDVSFETTRIIYDKIIGSSFGAALFMLCMGISISYSSDQTVRGIFKRGLRLLGLAFFLETIRTALPGLLDWLIYKDPAAFEYVEYFFAVDILQFAALFFLVLALFKALKFSIGVMISIGLAASLLGWLLCDFTTGSYAGDMAVGYLWRSHYTAFFPLLNWLIVPICGYALGKLWIHISDKEKLFKIITPVTVLVSVLYYGSMFLVGRWNFLSGGSYYGMGTIDVVFTMISSVAVIGLCYHLGRCCCTVARLLNSMGRRLTSIYCIHWTIYGFLCIVIMLLLGDGYMPQWSVFAVGVGVLLASNFISLLYDKKIKRKAKSK